MSAYDAALHGGGGVGGAGMLEGRPLIGPRQSLDDDGAGGGGMDLHWYPNVSFHSDRCKGDAVVDTVWTAKLLRSSLLALGREWRK